MGNDADRPIAGQVQEPYVPVPNDSELEFTITVDEASNKIIQQISVNGKEISHQADGMSPIFPLPLRSNRTDRFV